MALLARVAAGGVRRRVRRPERWPSPTSIHYYHFDGLGSVIALTDSSGSVVNLYEYSVYGEVSASDPNHPNRFLFTGREFDADTGLYYYRARYYNPYLGRFLQTDPVGYGAGMNLYEYCRNSPLNLKDPTGLEAVAFYDADDTGSDVNNDGILDTAVGANLLEAANDWPHHYPMTCFQDVIDTLKRLHDGGTKITTIFFFDHGNEWGQEFGASWGERSDPDFEKLLDAIAKYTDPDCHVHYRGCEVGKDLDFLKYLAQKSQRLSTGCTGYVKYSNVAGEGSTPDYSFEGDLWQSWPDGITARIWEQYTTKWVWVYKKIYWPLYGNIFEWAYVEIPVYKKQIRVKNPQHDW